MTEYNIQTNSISENLKIDDITVLKRAGSTGELRIGHKVTIDDQIDSETYF